MLMIIFALVGLVFALLGPLERAAVEMVMVSGFVIATLIGLCLT